MNNVLDEIKIKAKALHKKIVLCEGEDNRLPAAEIVPHTQRKGRQQHAAAPGAPVDHTVVVTVGRRLIG